MDLLSLPDVFLLEMMTYFLIKDRLSMRLTCRALDNLVAETNAGHFSQGAIRPMENGGKISIELGDAVFRFGIAEFEQFLHLRNRLFKGISFQYFTLVLHEKSLECSRQVVDRFTIDSLQIRNISSTSQLDWALSKIACRRIHIIGLSFLPESVKLLSLPPLNKLEISGSHGIDSELFFKLLNAQKCLELTNVTLTVDQWKRAMQILSSCTEYREVILWLNSATVLSWLNDCGITESTPEGRVGEFHYQGVNKGIIMRYKNCQINIEYDKSSVNNLVNVRMSACSAYLNDDVLVYFKRFLPIPSSNLPRYLTAQNNHRK